MQAQLDSVRTHAENPRIRQPRVPWWVPSALGERAVLDGERPVGYTWLVFGRDLAGESDAWMRNRGDSVGAVFALSHAAQWGGRCDTSELDVATVSMLYASLHNSQAL